ncbi:MAG: hypothetical protein AABY32_06125 [Nanoarchaeota archaeon]
MKNKTLANALIVIFILFVITDFFRTQSFAVFTLWGICGILFFIFSIWSIVKLYKSKFYGTATFGVIALIVSQLMPHGYSNPLYLVGIILLVIYVIVATQKLYKIPIV